jgi:hypothetical protein
MGYTMPFIKVIQRDYAEIEKNPIENVIVEKKDGDISEWNLMFHIENVKGDSSNGKASCKPREAPISLAKISSP